MTNHTHGECLVPPSLYIQSVRLRLVSNDIENPVQTNYDHYFDYIADFEMHLVNPEFLNMTETQIMTITGMNFNSSHSYTVVMNSTDNITYKFPT